MFLQSLFSAKNPGTGQGFDRPSPESWGAGDIDHRGPEQFLDFLPDLEHAFPASNSFVEEPFLQSRMQGDGLQTATTSAERKLHHNRLTQKRYRQRQKARSQTVESQLAETTTELANLRIRQQELEQRQRQLEARNTLLEKIANLNKQITKGLSPSAQTVDARLQGTLQADIDRALIGFTSSSEAGQLVTLTVDDQLHALTVTEIGQVSFSDCCEMYTMYARKLGECLLLLNDKEHCSALEDLQRWITELTTLGACITFGNPELLKAIQSGSLDDSGSPVQQLTDSFYADVLTAVDLTQDQVSDMLHLRRLVIGKLGQLARQRQGLVSRLHSDSTEDSHISDKLADLTTVTEQLQANGNEEYRTHMQLVSAMFRGVLTSKQVAIQVVHAYPRLLEKPRLLEVLAALNEEPPAKVLAQSMGLDDLQHAANWQQVEEYLKSFTVKDLNRHVPLVHST